jgi:hypothetical protein
VPVIEFVLVSTGIKFTTLPDATPPSFIAPSSGSNASNDVLSAIPLSQPPTTLTATYNPMMGHLSTAYAARVSRDLSLCSRFVGPSSVLAYAKHDLVTDLTLICIATKVNGQWVWSGG